MLNTDTIFNASIKEDFLKGYPENTSATYKRIFQASAKHEDILQRDLYDFNLKEIHDFLSDLKPLTAASSRTNGRIVSAYLSWAITNNFRHNKINPLVNVPPTWFDRFAIVEESSLYFTRDYLDDYLLKGLNNAQDAVIFDLLFHGVQGKSDVVELTNLKISDVDEENNILTLHDRDNTRILYVPESTIRLVKRAHRQRDYLKRNGEFDTSSNLGDMFELIQNEYILHNSKTRTDKFDLPVDKHTVYRRIDMVKEVLHIPHLTSKKVSRSGMIWYANKAYSEKGYVSRDDYQEIAKRFGINGWWRVQEICPEDTIRDLYSDFRSTTYK